MSKAWLKTAATKSAVITGVFAIAAAVIAALATWTASRDNLSSEPALVSFSLNSRECFFEPIVDADHALDLGLPGWKLTNEGDVVLAVLEAEKDDVPRGEIPQSILSELSEGVAESRAQQLLAIMLGKNGATRAQLISRLSPVFDAVILNRGKGTAVLTDVQVEIMHVEPPSEGGGDAPPFIIPGPIPVATRYVVPLGEFHQRQYFESAWPRLALNDPLEIPPQRPVRFQIQLHSVGYAMYYRLRLRFIINGDDTLATPVFSVRTDAQDPNWGRGETQDADIGVPEMGVEE